MFQFQTFMTFQRLREAWLLSQKFASSSSGSPPCVRLLSQIVLTKYKDNKTYRIDTLAFRKNLCVQWLTARRKLGGSEFSIVLTNCGVSLQPLSYFPGHSSPASTFACPHVKILLSAEDSRGKYFLFEAVKAFNCCLFLFQKFCRKSDGCPTVWWG